MAIRSIIKNRLKLLIEPHIYLSKRVKGNFELELVEYLKLLIFISILSAIINFTITLTKVFYLYAFYKADVNFKNMLNYTIGSSTSIAFLYVFLGTFGLFFISLVLMSFINIKYVQLLRALFFSLSPVLLFGFFIFLVPGLMIYSFFIFIKALEIFKKEKIHKKSIENRE